MLRISLGFSLLLVSTIACVCNAAENSGADDISSISESRAVEVDKAFTKLINKHRINTIGVAVIKNGKIQWQNYYGEQSPGIAASRETLFNVGSITKTVTAESILKLVEEGKISLDESMAKYWLDPDLKDSPDVQQLTVRMALTHTTGFMNWRFFSDDNKLKFLHPPGENFGYSGEGIRYLMKYAENKLGTPFENLVKAHVFKPLDMEDAYISVRKENFPRIARPIDENGEFYGYYCHPAGYCRDEGDYSPSGDMVITVTDYAKFLQSAMAGEGLSPQLLNDRNTLQGIETQQADIDCSLAPEAHCPVQMGYGLGWFIAQLENEQVIGHRGSDWSVASLAYYYENSRDGLILFINAPNKAGIAGMVDALELLDPDSPEIHGYKMRRARFSN